MNILEGQVVETVDITETGRMLVKLDSIGLTEVLYTSPFMGPNGQGGFLATPPEGSNILVVKPNNSTKYFYLTTIVGQDNIEHTERDQIPSKSFLPTKDSYDFKGIPMKYGIYSPKGHKLELNDSYNDSKYNLKAELSSHLGKRVSLNDSPEVDCLFMLNEHGDGIKISTTSNFNTPARSIDIQCKGPQRILSRNGQMEIIVFDGQELNIENLSTGLNRTGAQPLQYGNVNIRSQWKDVNIVTKSPSGRIFLDSLGIAGLLQVDSNGKLILHAGLQGIDIISQGDIRFQSVGNIQLQAGLGVDINALAESVNIQGTVGVTIFTAGALLAKSIASSTFSSAGITLVACDAAPVQINVVPVPGPVTIPPPPPLVPYILTKEINDYGQ